MSAKTLSEQSTRTLLTHMTRRDQRIELLRQELAQRDQRINALEEKVRAAELSAAHPPTLPIALQVFWPGPDGFTEAHSLVQKIPVDGLLRDFTLELPPLPAGALRIDPGGEPAFWDFQSLALHPILPSQAVTAAPCLLADHSNAFAGLSVAAGAMPVPGSEDCFSLFATSRDPQLHWALPISTGPVALTIRCRAHTCGAGYVHSLLLQMDRIIQYRIRSLHGEPDAGPRLPSLLRKLKRWL